MCINDNNAGHAQHFINAQLLALWSIATECAQSYSKCDKECHKVLGYDYALAEYYAPTTLHTPAPKPKHSGINGTVKSSKSHCVFHASFSEPTIDFVCAHELVYHLNIRSTSITGSKPTRVSFRVPYVELNLKGGTGAIGNGTHDIRSVILDFARM